MHLLYKGKEKSDYKELLRPLNPWEVNKRCLRSIEYKHDKHYPPKEPKERVRLSLGQDELKEKLE